MANMSEITVTLGLDMSDFNQQMQNASQQMQTFGQNMQNIGAGLTASLTVPLTAIGVGAMKVANDFQVSQGKLQASLGITEAQAKTMNGSVKKLWKEGFGESVDEVALGITKVSHNMKGLEGKELETATKNAFTLSKVFDADMNESTRSAGQLMKDFGVDSTKAFDMLTWGFQNGLDFSGEFLDTVREYSPQFAEMGYSGEQMMNVLKAGFDAGAWSLDKVGDAIKESHLRTTDMSKATVDAYSTLGLSAEEYAGKISKGGAEGNKAFQEVIGKLMAVEDETQRNLLSTALFGTQYEDLREKVIFAMGGAKKEIEGLEGTTARAGEAMKQNFGAKLTKVWRELQVAIEPLGIVLIDMAENLIPKLSSAVEGLVGWFTGLSSGQQQLVVGFGIFLAVIGPIIVALGTLVASIGALIPVFGGMIGIVAKAWGWLNKIRLAMNFSAILPFLTSPIGIAIGVLAGLIAIGILVYKNWDTIKAKAIEVWGYVSSFFSEVWTAISTKASEVWDGLTTYLSDTWTSIKDTASSFMEGFKQFFSDAWTSIKTTTTNVFNAIKDFFFEWVVGLLAWTPIGLFVGFIIENWDAIKEATSIIFEMIKAIIKGIFNAIMSVVNPIVEGIKNFVVKTWTAIRDKTKEIFNAVKTTLTNIWNSIKSVLSPIVTAIWTWIKDTWNKISSTTSSVFNAVKSTVTSIWNSIKSTITGVASNIWSAVTDKFNSVKSSVSSIFNSVKSTVTSIWNSIKSTITSVASSVWSTVQSKFNAVKDAMEKPINKAKDTIKSAVESIKGFFSGLKLTIPKPKYPKISVTKGTKSFFGQSVPYPKFDIKWNAKGNIFNGASLLGGGQGVGEAGAEVVMPIQHKRYMKPYAFAVAEHLDDMRGNKGGGNVVNHFNVSELVVREEADVERIAQKLYDLQQRSKRQGGRR